MISTSKALSIIKNNTNKIDNERVEVEKAIEILNDREQYNEILKIE